MSFSVLLAKEVTEIIRTRRVIVLPAVFLFFGILGPVLLHITPDLLKSQGLNITLPPPTPEQSAGEYLESVVNFASIALVLVAMGAVAEEKARGTIQIVLSKPARRSHFLVAKYMALVGLAAFSLALGSAACLYYTGLLIGPLPLASYVGSSALLAVFISFVIALTILFSTILPSQIAAGGATIAVFFTLGALPMLGGLLRTYSPHALYRLAVENLQGRASDIPLTVAAQIILTLLVLALAWLAFSRQEL